MISRKKTIIFLVIIEIIVLIFLGFLIFLQFKGIKNISQALANFKKEIILFQGKTGQLEQLKSAYQELEPSFKKIDSLFVDRGIPLDLIRFWEGVAGDSGLSIEISPIFIKAIETDPWKSMGFQLVLTGPSQNFLKFLEKTESGPYLTEVQNLVIAKQEKETEKEGVKATLSVKVFTK